eukprot:scaffold22390_cov28-Tisochrysis_lutea.AAC.12
MAATGELDAPKAARNPIWPSTRDPIVCCTRLSHRLVDGSQVHQGTRLRRYSWPAPLHQGELRPTKSTHMQPSETKHTSGAAPKRQAPWAHRRVAVRLRSANGRDRQLARQPRATRHAARLQRYRRGQARGGECPRAETRRIVQFGRV